MRVLILALLLAGCATTMPDKPVVHNGHEGPSMAEVAAQTSMRRELLKSAEVGNSAAMVASTLALTFGHLSPQDRDSMASAQARAEDALGYLRSLDGADEAMFTAAMFYVNFSNNELLKLAEGKRDD